jgi:single-strand DNA-binding protein
MRNLSVFKVTVVKEPELKFDKNGQAICFVRVAWNDNRRNEQGEWETQATVYATVKTFGNLAVNVAESFVKGMPMVVEATKMPEPKAYADKDGNPAASLDIIADNVLFPMKYGAVEVRRNEEKVTPEPVF